MSGLRKNDYARMLDLAVDLLEAREPDHIWRSVAQELLCALDGAVVVTKDAEWTRSGGPVGTWRRDEDEAGTPEEWTARHIRDGYPFADHYGSGTDRRPWTAAQLAGGRGWRHSETASAMRRSFGTDHMLALPLPALDSHVRGFIIHRAGPDFTERDREYAARVQPLLSGAAAQYGLLARRPGDHVPVPAGPRPEGDGPGKPGPRAAAPAGDLTPREAAVLHLLAEGLPAHAMARRLQVSVRTIHKHLQNLYRKLGTADRLKTVLRAQELGLLASTRP
ncbi:helix-turn-helix transcriptional regulator [Streptomyces sp. SP18CS02]|uniref:helix-turn-helix transcriptional regulator n=1 Tax=Streptomyces sp. SP18CS02 TaxID=3002531 RepID=UPI002E76BB21|nr:LuxR C-terminal-related transcriptional regulator [Streptomyces sp. SP18CS02]MEE1754641.1 LuxR C-terminal-related transcriptional regulator [Streptomyces sp. SP18CS02]